MNTKEIKEVIDNLNVGDKIAISIYDCGAGLAKVLEVGTELKVEVFGNSIKVLEENPKLKIEIIEPENWGTCYKCQIPETIAYVSFNEIFKIEKR